MKAAAIVFCVSAIILVCAEGALAQSEVEEILPAIRVDIGIGPVTPGELSDQRLRMSPRDVAAGTRGLRSAKHLQQAASRRGDSLKNGALIGAIAGVTAGAFLSAVGCGMGDLWEGGNGGNGSSCFSGTAILVGLGAGIGALIGVGVDALFEQGPSPGLLPGSRRIGLRLHFAF